MVNFSARVEGQAEGGEIVMSQSTKTACDLKAASHWSERDLDFVYTDKGKRALKGIKGAAQCWRVLPVTLAHREFEEDKG